MGNSIPRPRSQKRICPNCHDEKTFSSQAIWCKDCSIAYRKQHQSHFYEPTDNAQVLPLNPLRPFLYRNVQWKTLQPIGLTIKQCRELKVAHDGTCDICGKTEQEEGRALSLDHDHITGQIRGFLCSTCNMGLGEFGDDIERLEKAIEYLRKAKKSAG